MAMEKKLKALLERGRGKGRVVFVTGAGISAESGIPTFRGQEGYWTVGAKEYHPQEMATNRTFSKMPREVWRWYLYRRAVCVNVGPNDAHRALARLEQGLEDRFALITQNVDGLHLRGGNSEERTFQVHGNIDFMRSVDPKGRTLYRIPEELALNERTDPLTDDAYALLRCPDGSPARPHILWFDERYEEDLYHSDRAMEAAGNCDVMIVVGTSGAASLPMYAVADAARNKAAIIDINPSDNPFAQFTRDYADGLWVKGNASAWVPKIVDMLLA